MLHAYRESDLKVHELWSDFLTVFRPYAIRSWNRAEVAKWVYFVSAPIESPVTIGVVERYHAPLRAALERIKAYYGEKLPDKECLRMSVYAINATVGPEGIFQMLLVYGIMRRPARTTPCPQNVLELEQPKMPSLKFKDNRRIPQFQ